ncbi:hypothetical protein [Bradyrhizobium ganzhouense]|uniref:hypothetical protein n=1 Tax=Bradyrhizobium ganzhouense TaxID=1179767 RepID=UPI003CFBB003
MRGDIELLADFHDQVRFHAQSDGHLSYRRIPDSEKELNPMDADLLQHFFVQETLKVVDQSVSIRRCKPRFFKLIQGPTVLPRLYG